jgi:hypothetical protein
MAKNLKNLIISQSFQRLLQLSPDDNKTILVGTGSIPTKIRVSGSLEVEGDLTVSGTIKFGI